MTTPKLPANKFLERDILVATINHLLKSGGLNRGDLILTELSCSRSGTRADLIILTNNKLVAFEIKSASDTLGRLGDQLSGYRMLYDEVNVVADKKHTDKIVSDYGGYYNFCLLEFDNGKLSEKRRLGYSNEQMEYLELMEEYARKGCLETRAKHCLEFFWKVDLVKMARAHKLKYATKFHKGTLVEILSKFEKFSVVRERFINEFLLEKFKPFSDEFWSACRGREVINSDMDLLVRNKDL